MGVTALNIGFRRALLKDRWDRWVHLVTRIMGVHLSKNNDIFRCHLTESGQFLVKPIYLNLLDGHVGDSKKLEAQSSIKNQNFYVVPSQ
jgi:hypothetical protein